MYGYVQERAAAHPGALAICAPVQLSYAGLVERADSVAAVLWAAGLRSGGRVALLLDRSVDAVATMLATVRIGAAYVPIDPALPAARLAATLADADVTVVVTTATVATRLPVVRLDLPLPPAPPLAFSDLDPEPDTPAYIMYTSGSTGEPKGVVVPVRGILRLVQRPDYVSLSATDVILHAAPLGFDAATFEVWGALLNGASLAIVPGALPSLDTIAETIARERVTVAWLTSGLFHAMVDARLGALASLRQLLAGGDVLSPPHVVRALAALPGTTIINGYGPTENTTFTCCYTVPRDHGADMPLPIGRAIRGTTVWLLDEHGQPVAPGEEGELCAGGDGVALSYLNRPEATAASFVSGPDGRPMYRTGDRARMRPDGVVEFGGRRDRQVKIRGKRVALDEMEAELRRDSAVDDVAVVFQNGRTTAFVTGSVDGLALRRNLLNRLPEHMVPSTITVLDAMPLNRNGKLDRKALPTDPAPSDTVARLAAIWRDVLGADLSPTTNLFDGGANSLDVVRAQAAMADAGLGVSLIDLFAYPSIASLAAHLDGQSSNLPAQTGPTSNAIAIIGMAGRFPGADSVEALWQNLCDGVESITRFAPGELEDAFGPDTRADRAFVAARPVLDGIDQFEPSFFGMTRREAELTDPQQRLFLEIAYEAFEASGYDPATIAGRVGVFAGSSPNSYLLRNVLTDRAAVLRYTSDYQTGSYPTLLGAGADFLATRVAYKLNLRGPAVTVSTACSTALVAVAQACAALRAGDADMALAGGVSITLPQRRGYLHEPGGLASADGHVRPFDAAASGTVFGSGAAVVMLKRLADAHADGDHVHAVIRGVAINNDGAGKVGFTAPSVAGQAACIAAAQAQAGITPAAIGFVEAHGTATPLGDPIEVAALRDVWGADAPAATCVLGSAKGNVGHLDAAAGGIGLLKAALAVERATIPGTKHFQTPNPAMMLEASPFTIQAETARWKGSVPRRAGVSAFGVGGTNAHAVLEQAPLAPAAPDGCRRHLLVLSARSTGALAETRTRLAKHLAGHGDQALADIAWTLQTGRRHFTHRAAVSCASVADAVSTLTDGRSLIGERHGTATGVAFLFPGQGSQHPGMGAALYQDEPVFREAVDRCATILQPEIGLDLRDLLCAQDQSEGAERLKHTAIAQPALFTIGYATAQTWIARGIRPAAMLGHSVGEFVAACLAGVFNLEDALGLIAARGRLMAGMPSGAMLSVRLPEAELVPLLGNALDLAAVNAPSLCVAAGPHAAVEQLEATLASRSVLFRRLHTSHAFHSRMMDGVAVELARAAASVVLFPPTIPFVSGVTGTWITATEATTPAYWANHCRAPVRFAAGVETLVAAQTGLTALLECGPGHSLSTLAMQGAARGGPAAIPSLPDPASEASAFDTMAEALGRLWLAGAEPDWRALHGGAAGRRRVPLPATPWDRTRCWIDEPDTQSHPEQLPAMDHNMPAADTTLADLVSLFEDLSGDRLVRVDAAASFIQLGFDSLFLGQVAQQVRSRFSTPVTFRQLLGELGSFAALAKHVAAARPKAAPLPIATTVTIASPVSPPVFAAVLESTSPGAAALMQQQVQAMSALFAQQLAALGTAPAEPVVAQAVAAPVAPTAAPSENTARFDAFKVVASESNGLTAAAQAHVASLVAATVARTPKSKRMTAEARSHLADPRAAAGFRPEWKEMTYPIVAVRSAGPHIWDADGNKYVDLVNGFGQTAFGHAPGFVVEAVRRQLDLGFEIGPQAELAGKVAARFCAITRNERMTFCNTGSEAVMAAMRIARTVTGRSRIVTFAGDYHGQFDEVLIKAGAKGTNPVAPGIPRESVSNMTVLEYGVDASLAWIREHADEIAAVIAEPVQSRHPALQPRAFLAELRSITERSSTCLVFDEVVTGFRTHAGGMQALFDIRADLATYGKVVGGGLPIGILAGKAAFMDALDGGAWQFGDDSVPEAAVTFFAGTFVRHPLALAAMDAVLSHIEASGPSLQSALAERTTGLVTRLNQALSDRGLPACIEHFASWFYFKLPNSMATLLYPNMRLRGVHIQEGFPCFLTTTHGAAELETIASAFTDSLDALQAAGLLLPAGASIRAITTPLTEAPLTEAQMEVWLAAQLSEEASCAFNEGISLHMRGRLDVTALRESLSRVLTRHDALRARFTATGDRMVIAPAGPLNLLLEEGPLELILDEEATHPFDLVAGPLLRTRLVRLAAEHHVLVLTVHHIVCDGWSINTLMADLAEPGALPPALSFAAYAADQRQPRNEADLQWWTAQYASPPAPLTLPADRLRPALKSFRGGTRRLDIQPNFFARLKQAGAAEGCTLFATMLAAVGVLIGRLAGQTDVVVAVPAAAQSQLDGEVLVGHCANLLPLRATWSADTAFSDHLRAVRHTVLDGYEHQDCTLGTIVRALNMPRDTSRLPLSDVQFNLERLADGMAMPGLDLEVRANPKAFVNFDLFFNAVESAAGLTIDCDYSSDLFDSETVDRWLGHLHTLLGEIVADPTRPIGTLPLLSAEERRMILHLWNETTVPLPAAPVHRLIEARVNADPDAIAVRLGDAVWSYGALDDYANQIANHLVGKTNPGDRVAVMLDRTPTMLAVLLATWKAGLAYVPLDPGHPPARLQHVLADARVALLVTDGTGPTLEAPTLDLRIERASIDALPRTTPVIPCDPNGTAYVIYTSGSTGLPKGVAVGHSALGNLLLSMAREPGITASDIWLAVTTIGFDIAGLELFGPLVAGGQIVLASRADAVDGHRLLDLLETTGATIMQATPATWRLLLEAGFKPGNIRMLCGGEALPRALADRLLVGGGALWNVYGPTETTIWSAFESVGPGLITVGYPVANTVLHVLDAADGVQPIGVPGHLHIGGAGLAEGYYNRPDLTSERFIPDPLQPGQRLYRTGDLARRLADGRVQVLGRIDSQIKLRGYRIEAGEIEHMLTTKCDMAQAAVGVRENGDEARLLAWVVPKPGASIEECDIRRLLRQSLPEYMIPVSYTALDRLPLTPNGKIDRLALPEPIAPSAARSEAPRTDLERQLAAIWSDVLRRPIGRDDDLLAMAADSIQFFQITARARAAGLELLARQLLEHRTVAGVTAALSLQTAPPPKTAAPRLAQFRRDRRMVAGE